MLDTDKIRSRLTDIDAEYAAAIMAANEARVTARLLVLSDIEVDLESHVPATKPTQEARPADTVTPPPSTAKKAPPTKPAPQALPLPTNGDAIHDAGF